MSDRTPLYTFEHDPGTSGGPALERAGLMIVALGGFIDAGSVQQIVAEHLIATCESDVVASFRIDELYDYRARRPVMTFERDRWTSYADPALLLHRCVDEQGQRFWLLTGPEPDYQWERFVADVIRLMTVLGVDLVVSVHGIPMGLPHTRPLGTTTHGTNPSLLPPSEQMFGAVQVPGSVMGLLEYRLGERGRNVIGFAVHVPHYLAGQPYATAALTAFDGVLGVTGLHVDRTPLVERAAPERAQLDAECAERAGLPEMVAALEEQYDAYMAGRARESLLAGEGGIPSADEIGAQAEEFLRQSARDGDDPPSGFGGGYIA